MMVPVHQQYNLVFKVLEAPIWGLMPICEVNQSGELPHLQAELSSFIERSDDKDGGMVDYMIDEINKILKGTWEGFEHEGDHFFYTQTNESIKLDLHDGFAYLALDSGWSPLPRIPLADLKAIFEEWVAFRDAVYKKFAKNNSGNKYFNNILNKWRSFFSK